MERDKEMNAGFLKRNHKGEACPVKPILCQEGYCHECQIYLDYLGHLKTMGRLSSLNGQWLREYEKEQANLVQLLKLQVTDKRKGAYAEAICGNREHKLVFAAMVGAYDVCLGLIDKIQGGE